MEFFSTLLTSHLGLMEPPPPLSLDSFQRSLGYTFGQPALLERALTHPSAARHLGQPETHNQRLEFLGDSVLSTLLAEALFQAFPNEREGVLTRARAALVNRDTLCALAHQLHIPDALRLAPAERKAEAHLLPSVCEDALEALIGAIFLDGGYDRARQITLQWYGDLKTRLGDKLPEFNPKGRLQEHIQTQTPNATIQYDLADSSGPDHAKSFTIHIHINGTHWGTGQGTSKKEAEEAAARKALEKLAHTDRPSC